MEINHKEAIACLEESGQYKVLKRLQPCERYLAGSPASPRIGIVLDTETTGLDTQRDKIIELGFIAFEYDANSGNIYRILHTYNGFEDPKQALSDVVKKITGITDAMLQGKKLDEKEIEHWLEKADVIIAHNAAYDRQILEQRLTAGSDANWACTINDIDWLGEGIGSRKLDYVAYQMGFFFDAHRAVNDALATLHLLSKKLPSSGQLAMQALLNSAREKSRRYFAIGAPFEKKDTLKDRGYRWLANTSYTDAFGNKKKGVWSKSVAWDEAESEQQWLESTIYTKGKAKPVCIDVSAAIRYATREFQING